MTNKISYLIDENGDKISPVVNINSIYTDDGKTLLDYLHPIGSIYISTTSTDPGTIFGGTWVQWGQGRVPVGVDTENSNFNTVEKQGGEQSHSLTVSEIPSHTHSFSATTGSSGSHQHSFSATTGSNGKHQHSGKKLESGVNSGTSAAVNDLVRPDGMSGTSCKVGNSTGAHTHSVSGNTSNTGAHTHSVSGTTGSSGSGSAMSLLQPYITCYMWKRTN